MPEARLKLRPFTVPNFVIIEMPARPKQEGIQESPKFSLGELDTETLNALVDEFRLAVHARAEEQRRASSPSTAQPDALSSGAKP